VAITSLSSPSHAQTLIPGKFAIPKSNADASKPGFIWNVHQTRNEYGSSFQRNSNARTEAQLSGDLKDESGALLPNLADPSATGIAKGPGVGPTPAGHGLITFEIEGTINMSQNGSDNAGRFQPDDVMPGIPGVEGGTDDIAGELLTYLELAPGTYQMVVNSDDGFVCYIGGVSPLDRFAIKVGEFDGGRGAADTTFGFTIEKEGLFPARVIWEEGGGGANIEWFTVKADGTRVLVNDAANGGIKAYRAIKTTGAAVYAGKVIPGPGQTGVAPNATLQVVLQNVGALAASDVKLTLDGAATTATVSKTGSSISVTFTPATLFASESKHSASLTYGAAKVDWDFTAARFATLTADLKVTPDTSKRGFLWRVHQNNAAGQANNNTRTERQLAGEIKDADGNPIANLADPSAVGGADGPAKAADPAWAPITFEVSKVINFDQAAGSNGAFTPDEQMPGIPGVGDGGSDNSIAAEIITYIDLPAGVVTMGVNSDDGFRTSVGLTGDVFNSPLFAGEFNGGRGAADTIFNIVVKDPGVFPFRTSWEEGGGGANIEWFTVKDGKKILVNDDANGGVKAYRAILPTAKKVVARKVVPVPSSGGAALDQQILVELVDGSGPLDATKIALKLDGTAVTASSAKQGDVTTVTFKPATPFAIKSTHTVALTYPEGTSSVTREWKFTTQNNDLIAYWDFNDASDPTKTTDKVGRFVGTFESGAKYTADAKGRTGKAGDRAAKTGSMEPLVEGYINVAGGDVAFMNAGGIQNQLAISLWQRLDETKNSSAFWAIGEGQDRAFQAHVPWGDKTIYFDTGGGCCDGTQRINKNISELAGANPDDFFLRWHHFVFQKDRDKKQIWVDGKLFHEGVNNSQLPFVFTRLWIGATANAGNPIHGDIDDFAVFASALTEAEIGKLASGTSPDQVRPVSVVVEAPKFTKFTRNADGTYTLEWTGGGTLQAAPSVTGPWQDVPGAASPYIVRPAPGALFGRIRK
jgi:hypothetical protein